MYLHSLSSQHVVNKEVRVKLGTDNKLISAGGKPGRLDREVFKVDCLDLGVLFAIDLRKRHVALKQFEQFTRRNPQNGHTIPCYQLPSQQWRGDGTLRWR